MDLKPFFIVIALAPIYSCAVLDDTKTITPPATDVRTDSHRRTTDSEIEKKRLGTRVLFLFDSVQPTADGARELDELIDLLERSKVFHVHITGHSNLEGSPVQNLFLSQKRAEFVKSKLESVVTGVEITSEALGDSNPIASNDTELGQQLNRRVEIRYGYSYNEHEI